MDTVFMHALVRAFAPLMVGNVNTLLAASHLILTLLVALLVTRLLSTYPGLGGGGGGGNGGGGGSGGGRPGHIHALAVLCDGAAAACPQPLLNGLGGHIVVHDEEVGLGDVSVNGANVILRSSWMVTDHACQLGSDHVFCHTGSNWRQARGKCSVCGLF
jgi:hypothetical protein